MKNFVQNGEVITITAGAAITSGDPVLIGSLVGIAQTSVASGESLACKLEGVFTCKKKSTDTPAQGDKLYWDNTNKEFTTTASGNTLAGNAWAAAASGVTTVQIRLMYS
jgi:predicted RecA/RadA family phage recombinase